MRIIIAPKSNRRTLPMSQKGLPTNGFDQQEYWVKCHLVMCHSVWVAEKLTVRNVIGYPTESRFYCITKNHTPQDHDSVGLQIMHQTIFLNNQLFFIDFVGQWIRIILYLMRLQCLLNEKICMIEAKLSFTNGLFIWNRA